MKKKTLVYFNNECFIDTDITVIKHLTETYHVIWYPIISDDTPRYTKEFLDAYAKNYNIEIYCQKRAWKRRSIKELLFASKLIYKIRTINPDIIFTGNIDFYWTIVAIFFLKLEKMVIGIHDYELHSNFQYSKIFGMIQKLSFCSFKNFVFYSKPQRKLFDTKYHKKTTCVGLSLKSFGNTSIKHTSYNKIKFLFFGSINSYKGLDSLISATESLIETGYNNFELSICGKGTFWEECKSIIRHHDFYKLNIRFIDNSEVPDLFSSHHYLVLPYRDATQSGPLMIALNYELPIIAPSFPCFTDIYTDKSALLYEADQKDGLKSVLIKALEMDNNQYSLLKRTCSSLKNDYSECNIAKRYIDFFKTIDS